MLNKIIEGNELEAIISDALFDIHKKGPNDSSTLETLAYIKKFHPETLKKYEPRLISLMGLFYKTGSPNSFIEILYSTYAEAIQKEYGRRYTPLQASAYKAIDEHDYFSFSAPTSSGKSYLLRDIIQGYKDDIVIIVPSRALISEYYYEVTNLVNNKVLVLQFIEDIYKSRTERRIYVVTPERASELFKYNETFNIGLILMDEAQISEEPMRGVRFDAFVRRSNNIFPNAKKVFAHPFIKNPNAQLVKHSFFENAYYKEYNLHSVGKIFLSHQDGYFKYFSPYKESKNVKCEEDVVEKTLTSGGTALIFISKASIYNGRFTGKFQKYIDICPEIEDQNALDIINSLRSYIGASKKGSEKQSKLIEMMERGIVVHHGSIPLKARLLIEKFVKNNHAHICFATSTLNQGINMPFDVVWVDNFTNMDALTLKNLIGRSGRASQKKDRFDYGYTIINSRNIKTFKERIAEHVSISEQSRLDSEASHENDDLGDIIDAVKENTFNDEFHLPQSQINRLTDNNLKKDIVFILDNLVREEVLISSDEYYELSDTMRKKIKTSLRNIYTRHLKRGELTTAEAGVLSASIPILLWKIKGKSFSEIVSLRHSFLSKRDDRRAIERDVRTQRISREEGDRRLSNLKIRMSPIAFSLPQKNHKAAPLYPAGTPVEEIDYDKIVYDTYDFLDKVISLSLSDPICAAFEIYFSETGDHRAKTFQNFVRYGTNNNTEIWLMKYGIDPEDFSWIKPHLEEINEDTIEFKDSVLQETWDRLMVIDRYL